MPKLIKNLNMRFVTTLFLMGIVISSFGQYVNGPANIRDKPNGEKLFSVNNYVSIQINGEPKGDWYKVGLLCSVKRGQLIDKKKIMANAVLYNAQGDSIGIALSDFQVANNFDENSEKYKELDVVSVELVGYTFKGNIRDQLSFAEIVKNKTSFSDTCQTSFVTFKDDYGANVTLIHKCDMYETSLLINDEYVPTFVKEYQDITRSGGEGQLSTINLELKADYFNNRSIVKKFSVEADELEVEGKLIKTVKYGCCDSRDFYQLFNSLSFNKLMVYESKLFTINIPNSYIQGYLGFVTSGELLADGKMILGTLTFTDGEKVINKVRFITKNKQLIENDMVVEPEMEFFALNQKDDVKKEYNEIELWTKDFSKSSKDLSGFQFLVHFIDSSTGKRYTQKLNFVNGFINGNSKTEFDINID